MKEGEKARRQKGSQTKLRRKYAYEQFQELYFVVIGTQC